MFTREQLVRRPDAGGSGQTGIGVPNGGVFPVDVVHHQTIPVQSIKVAFDANFEMTAAPGGAADGQGLKIATLPAGKKHFLGSKVTNLQVTTQADLSVATAVFALGSAAAGSGNAALAGTEADIVGSTSLGDGTLAGGATETEPNLTTGGLAGTVGLTPNASASELDVYLNAAGTFTHASDTLCDLRITGEVELFFIDLGADA